MGIYKRKTSAVNKKWIDTRPFHSIYIMLLPIVTFCRSVSFAEESKRRENICCTRASVEFICCDYEVEKTNKQKTNMKCFIRAQFQIPDTSQWAQSAHYLLLDLCPQLSEQILEGFVFGLQLGTPLGIQESLVKSTEFEKSLSSPKPGFHVTWVIV